MKASKRGIRVDELKKWLEETMHDDERVTGVLHFPESHNVLYIQVSGKLRLAKTKQEDADTVPAKKAVPDNLQTNPTDAWGIELDEED